VTRSLAIVLLLALTCAVGAWLVSRRSTEPLTSALPPEAQTQQPAELAPALESGGGATQHLPAAAAPRAITSKPEPIVGPKATLDVLCVRASDGRPAADLRLEVVGYPLESGGARSEILQVTDHYSPPMTDENGRASIEVPAAIALYVGIDGTRFSVKRDGAHCAALEEGQHKLVRLEVHLSNDARVRGLVLDAASGEAQSGVRVSSNERSQSLLLATTGNDGRFEVPATTGGTAELRLEKDGYVTHLAHIAVATAEPAEEQVFRLVLGAVVQGFVLDGDRAPVHQSSVRIWLDPGFETRSYCDPRGWFSIEGLPPGVELQIEIEQWRRRVRTADPIAALEPGETRRLDLLTYRRARIDGIALDENHAPVAGVELALVPAPLAGLPCMIAELAPQETVKTDSEGRFAFTNACEGSWAVGPAVRTSRNTARELPSVPVLLSLPADAGRVLEVPIHQHANIQGRVLDPDGQPARGALVTFRLEGCPNPVAVPTAADGRFSARVLGPWSYRVHASRGSASCDSDELSARADSGEVVLTLRRAARLEVHLSRADGSSVKDGDVFGVAIDAGTNPLRFHFSVEAGGRAGIELAPGAYRCLAVDEEGHWSSVKAATVSLADASEVLELTTVDAAPITVVTSGYATPAELHVLLDGILVDERSVSPGSEGALDYPPGRLSFEHRLEGSTQEWSRVTCDAIGGRAARVVLAR
jgi:hypothetical protein